MINLKLCTTKEQRILYISAPSKHRKNYLFKRAIRKATSGELLAKQAMRKK
jgi:hypothetical protein